MSSLADFPELIGFFSYSREDDDDSEGALSRLRDRIQRELAAQLGRSRADFRLWQDKAAIPHGALWEGEIASAIAQSVFFIPIITPRAIKSTHCAFEFDSFLRREAELGRADLVFPILYIPVPALEDERLWRLDPILKVVGTRQYLDWHTARHRSFADSAVAEKVEYFCRNISRALQKPWTAPNQPEREKTVGPTREVDVQDRLSRAEAEERPPGARKITRFARVGFIAGAAALGIFGTAALYWHNRSAEQTPPVSVSTAPQTPSPPAEAQPTADFKAALAHKSYVEAFGLARPAAERGDREAQFIVGWLYYNGRGVDPSDDMAAAWFQKAARQNHLFAQLNLADMYEAGVGVPRSNEEAFYWYRRAADQGNADAQTKVGIAYEEGTGVSRNAEQALNWYRKAADQGHPEAQNRLGIAYAQGLGTQRDDGQAFMWYQKAAEQKYARALKNLGDMWFAGRGVPRADANEALKHYKQAAEQNFGPAEFNIGYLYETGFEGQQRDSQKAVEWYKRATAHGSAPAKDALTRLHIDSPAASDNEAKKDSAKSIFALAQSAAESGDRDAQYTLASLYLTGDKDKGIERDEAKAATWYQKAAEQGHRSAQAKLGGMYEEGSGVQRSYAQAFTWYRKAAEQGDPEAQNNLGSLYARGLGTDRDDAAAVSWYQKAVKEAYAAAQKNLADMYAAGRGVQRDDREALRLYKLAADQEDADAEDELGHFFENGLGGAQRDYQEAFKWYCKALDDGSDDAQKHVDALRKKARIKDKCDTGGGPVINFGGFHIKIGGKGYRAHRSKGD